MCVFECKQQKKGNFDELIVNLQFKLTNFQLLQPLLQLNSRLCCITTRSEDMKKRTNNGEIQYFLN